MGRAAPSKASAFYSWSLFLLRIEVGNDQGRHTNPPLVGGREGVRGWVLFSYQLLSLSPLRNVRQPYFLLQIQMVDIKCY